jgi:hypothetical protein
MPSPTGRVGVCHGGMVLRRTPHAVDERRASVVWAPQGRCDVWHGAGHQRLQARSTARVQRGVLSKPCSLAMATSHLIDTQQRL